MEGDLDGDENSRRVLPKGGRTLNYIYIYIVKMFDVVSHTIGKF